VVEVVMFVIAVETMVVVAGDIDGGSAAAGEGAVAAAAVAMAEMWEEIV